LTLTEAFEILYTESQRPDRRIRYSMYPSRRDLDVLWGHVTVVGDRQLYPLERQALPEEFTSGERAPMDVDERAGLFLSHSMQDFSMVYDLRARLEATDQRVWIFEDDLNPGDIVHHAIRDALNSSEAFGAYLSDHYLQSLYSDKEVEQLKHNAKPIHFFFNDESRPILELATRCFEATWAFKEAQIGAFLDARDLDTAVKRNLLETFLDLIAAPETELHIHAAASPVWLRHGDPTPNPFFKLNLI
ncbi:MAG: toll/interleukin-1 receptor domain-containing protein, partial [Pseudomonadota bacterium]